MRSIRAFAVASLAAFVPLPSVSGLPAFPGAEGFGADTKGGRGGRVIQVTSLEDSGPGTLREACTADGPRIVVFQVGGTITLQTQIAIENPFITIAGQTAPGDGILLRKGQSGVTPVRISTHDVVLRGIRIRTGDSAAQKQTDCLEIYNTDPGDNCYNIVIDHCSFSWSTDENLAIMGRYIGGRGADNTLAKNWDRENTTRDVTVQWCINSEGLLTPEIKKSRGALIKFIRSFSYHHNLMAHNAAPRNPRLQGHVDTIKDVVNNVIYNTSRYGTGPSDHVRFNYVGNYQKSGSDTQESYSVGSYGKPSPFTVYLKGNYHSDRRTSDRQDERLVLEPLYWEQVVAIPYPTPPVRTTTAPQAYEEVLKYAGCIIPRRDSVDERIIEEVRAGTGRIKTSVRDTGGYPKLTGGVPPKDADRDGMPDAWETRHGLDPVNGADGNQDRDGDGYTNVEEYINSLIRLPAQPKPL